ncbi:MAG TPA: type I DNA topoisomerase [Candidatus Kapabacteria bacterium]|nr:type I DNA topoisomerase [Candidatus Kapabacteria bacterium]
MGKSVEDNGKSLVIVESPAKAKTIEKYLGSNYIVASSVGHIRDLPKKDLSIDIENGFEPIYEVSALKKKVVSELKSLSNKSKEVLLATDEDREGEAIAWHLAEVLKLDYKKTKRIAFHEITKKAINNAIENPRVLDLNLVNAQQARRVLDRLVGYELSPILWKKVQRGLSAGRVQSVSVRLIVERENEIDNFVSESNYKVNADFLTSNNKMLPAELKTRFNNLEETKSWMSSIINSTFLVDDTAVKPAKRTPSAPFTTSTLQQEASRKLGFSVKQTMVIAQKLYESGKITYMRTDSVNLSDFALESASDVINSEFGNKYHKRRAYKNKNESAQEAHEAIRPTDLSNSSISGDRNSVKLYELIWKRTIASQMADAELEKTTINIKISNKSEIFQAVGEVIKFDGFLKLYLESTDEESNDNDDNNKILPQVQLGESLDYSKIVAKEIYKNTPPRYTEASLVKKLEEMGIGRPSTYAPTISTIIDRGYVLKEDREGKVRNINVISIINKELTSETKSENYGSEKQKLFPTNIGIVVNDFLVKYFSDIVDYHFTAKIEEEFDNIAKGNIVWNKMIADFYSPFKETLDKSNDIKRSEAINAQVIGIEPKSGKTITAKIGRFGPMLQLGDTEAEEKPRFAAIPKHLKMSQISLEEAIQLFELPRLVGTTESGDEVVTQIGRFGPYVKCGTTFVSIPEEEIFTITLEEAIEKIEEKKFAKSNNTISEFEEDKNIKVLRGRFGPYITNGTINVKIPKNFTPELLSYEECKNLIENSDKKKTSKGGKTKKTAIKK